MQCECLVRRSERLIVTVRFLQLVKRARWQEAIEREIKLEGAGTYPFRFDAQEEQIEGAIEVNVRPVQDGWSRVTVRISNSGAFDVPGENSAAWAAREAALRRSPVSTHTILRAPGGEFASLLDPPEELRGLAAECSNVGLWPVLAGDSAMPDTMLGSPIILYDYPQIAPESAGALFDGTEIDEILSLRILTLTDEEKREMQETDPKARSLLERTEALDPEQWLRLHGVMRGVAKGSG
jgi:hypothetical protein